MTEGVPEWQQAAEDVAATLRDDGKSEEVVRMVVIAYRVAHEGTTKQREYVQDLVIQMGAHGDAGPAWWIRAVEEYMQWV